MRSIVLITGLLLIQQVVLAQIKPFSEAEKAIAATKYEPIQFDSYCYQCKKRLNAKKMMFLKIDFHRKVCVCCMVAFLSFFSNTGLKAQVKDTLTIISSFDEVLKLVDSNNFDLKSYQYNTEKTQLALKNAKAHRFPTISGTFNGQRNLELATTPVPGEIFGQPGSTINVQFGQEYTYNTGITVTKSLFDWQASLQVQLSKIKVETAELQMQSYKDLLHQQAGVYYFSALVAKQATELWEQDIQLADSIALLTKQKFEEGIVDRVACNKIEINTSIVRQNLNESQKLYNQSMSELKKLMGIRPDEKLSIEHDVTHAVPDIYAAGALSPNKQIALASLQKQQAKTTINIQKSAFVPKLSFTSYFGRQQFQDDFGLSFGNDAWSNFSYLGLNLSIPIFTGFASKNRLKSSKLDYKIAKEDWENQQLISAIDDTQLLDDYYNSLKNTELSKEILELYHQNKELTFQQYTEGLVSLDKYLNIFEDCLKAENTFLNNLLTTYNYYSQIFPRIQQP